MYKRQFFVNSYVKPRLLTHDPERVASYVADPLISRPISVTMLLGLYEAADRVVADAQAIQLPTQLLVSGADLVVERKPQELFFQRLGSARKELHVLPGFFHDTLGERDRAHALARISRFVEHCFASPVAAPSLLDADKTGASCAEAESLAAPLPRNSPRDLYWRATRAGLRLGQGLSEGVKLGFDTGFDSGSTLISEKGLADIARFVQGDAFDRQSLATLEQPPTLAVVSGLYELFASNQLVGNSLAGVDQVAAIFQRIDEWGIFSVSLAQRVR